MGRAGMERAVSLAGLVAANPGSGLAVRPPDVAFSVSSFLAWKPFQQRTRACEAFVERAKAAFWHDEGAAKEG